MALTKADIQLFKRTKKIIETLPAGTRERAAKLVTKLEFMNNELQKLEAIISEKGWVEEYCNGANQFGLKKCSEGEVYNSLIKNFTSSLKALNDMLPEEAPEMDDLEKWLNQ